MIKTTIMTKKRIILILLFIEIILTCLIVRVFYLQSFKAEYYQEMAYEQQTRDRLIAPRRGNIYDRNGEGLALSETVGSVSVIHAQIKNKEEAAKVLSEKLGLNYDNVLKKIEKNVALERIKTKVDKETSEEIRKLKIPGVVVDEDIKRVYPYENLASQVIGFVGKDNQGIIGLEAKYEEYMKGEKGKILTEADARGVELQFSRQNRIPPVDGYNVVTSIDLTVQMYAEQTLEKAVEFKEAKRGTIIVMNPQNGEIYAMANKPDFNLNEPFKINNAELLAQWSEMGDKDKNDALNKMWRNFAKNVANKFF